ncbi:DCC1-like thiol-disulfide oxidoreductase family protein [Halalkalicoccus paucihalophilus]|uniref:DCC1-like thiol-disulfide oxidoreductase family protein n=1 Tax=Halalkalicoccus paucihalophilus TaxID=1008153 RepID=UPI00082D7A7E|nr:DCC1-like thiol-disulfide oxidoreductase family protein [Halalkalicoccus paucihalophilus]
MVVAVRAPPRLVYDDDCGFCTWCAEYADSRGVFELVGFSELSPDQRARLPPGYENCVHLLTDDAVFSCGQAVEEIGARLGPRERTAIKFFRMIPGHERLREPFYRSLADRRVLWGRFVRRG